MKCFDVKLTTQGDKNQSINQYLLIVLFSTETLMNL